ncbi:86d7d136-d8f3-4032-b247-2e46fde6a79f [Thermothielavioides terrestris]|uniref:86d7d136-d8f3-4032-b247-2e46fde6a79f n=1 Tax=Thermothielavioides terrestris TaxID=2587410 RepID=A0A3S4AXI6_9PEZI|nr:86d7d136-d8f3-4032-b247-2e46fde6a79f [Thermothielavioides terrestris]
MAQVYTLNVLIDNAVLALHSKDSLCIAKKVNGVYDVVFQGAAPVPSGDQKLLLANNQFQWTEEYRVFLTQSFGNGVMISHSTTPVEISFGQVAIWKDGALQPAVTADTSTWDLVDGSSPDTTFAVESAPISLHAAVEQSTGGGQYSTIYVDPDIHMGDTRIELTPKNEYLVFWKKITTTEAMLAISTSVGHQWKFAPGKTIKTIRFGYATPEQPSSALEIPTWYEM